MEEGRRIPGVKGGRRKCGVVPLALDQIVELLESAVTDQLPTSAAALLYRVEGLLLRGTGATGVDAFLVDHWLKKLLRFSPAHDTHGTEERQVGATAAEDDRPLADAGGMADHGEKQREPPEDKAVFDTKAVCSIGEGVAGMAAMTGCRLRIRDCSKTQRMRRKRPSFATDYKSGSLVCWPVQGRTNAPAAAAATGTGEPPPMVQPEDVDCDAEYDDEAAAAAAVAKAPQHSAGAVLAVLQVHCADGELPAEALEVLHGVGRLLVPLLTDVLDRDRETVRRRSTEALLSLSSINLRRTDLMEMIEEIVRVAQRLTEAARVCFLFVDDSCEELWVAKAVGFCYGAKIKIGEGLCGHAAATGQIVNVIDSYEDSRFDPRFDEQTGSVTGSALCAPIPPPDYTVLGNPRRRSLWRKSRRADSATQGRACRLEALPQTGGNQQQHQQQQQAGATSSSASSHRGGLQGSPGGVAEWPMQHQQGSSQAQRRPLAVLMVTNKRGRGVFNKYDEEAVWRLSVCVESLLRSKAAEVALLNSGMAERFLVRKSNSAGGPGGAWSNYARVQSTIMRLYSQASFPIDIALRGKGQRRKISGGLTTNDGGGGSKGAGSAGLRHSLGGNKLSPADLGPVRTDGAEDQRQAERDKGISGRMISVGRREKSSRSLDLKGVGFASPSGVSGGVHRILHREGAQEDPELVDLSMSLFDMTNEKLLSLVQRFFQNMGLTDTFKISDQKLQSFTRAVDRRYQLHPFHNLTHAVSVTHVSFMISKTTRAASLLRPLDKLGLLVAAFCHDIDHPGNNNAFEVNSLSPLALLYGDSSVLERHHVFITYQVLLEEGGANDIFSGLTRAQFRDVRQTIVQAILGTDMSRHMEHCAEVFRYAQNTESLSPTSGGRPLGSGVMQSGMSPRTSDALASSTRERERSKQDGVGACGGQSGRAGYSGGDAARPPEHIFSVDNVRDRSFLTKTIIHCADLSGQVLDRDLALEWGRRILEEFRLQARLEGNMGLPRTTVASGDLETTTKGQHFFAAKIVKPLWEPFVGLFPSLMPLLDNLNKNCDYYRDEGSRLERQRLSEAAAAAAAAATSSDTLSSSSKSETLRRKGRGKKGKNRAANAAETSAAPAAPAEADETPLPRTNAFDVVKAETLAKPGR